MNGEQCCRTPEEGTVTNPIHPSEVYFMHLCVLILQEKKELCSKMTSLQTAVKNKPWPQRTRTPLWSKRAGGVWGEAEEGRGRERRRGGGAGWMICSWNMEHMKTKKKDKWHKAGQPRYSRCWRRGCSPLALCQVPGLQSVLWSIVTQHGVRSLWAAGNRVLERGQFNLPKKQIWLEKKTVLVGRKTATVLSAVQVTV